MKPYDQFPAPHKFGYGGCAFNLSTQTSGGRGKGTRGFMVVLNYSVSSRLAWTTWDLTRNGEGRGELLRGLALGSSGLVTSRKEEARGQEGNESLVSPGTCVSFIQV